MTSDAAGSQHQADEPLADRGRRLAVALDLGGLTPILYGFGERDEIVEMLAALTGQKLLFNYMRIGGVNGDLNHEFMSRLGDWMSHAAERVNDQATLMNENSVIVVGRPRN